MQRSSLISSHLVASTCLGGLSGLILSRPLSLSLSLSLSLYLSFCLLLVSCLVANRLCYLSSFTPPSLTRLRVSIVRRFDLRTHFSTRPSSHYFSVLVSSDCTDSLQRRTLRDSTSTRIASIRVGAARSRMNLFLESRSRELTLKRPGCLDTPARWNSQ